MRAAALLLFLLAAPAAAQNGWMPGPSPDRVPGPVGISAAPDTGIARERRDVEARIRAARGGGQITRVEARGLRREARANAALGSRLADDGLSLGERREIDARSAVLRDRVTARRSAGRP